MCSSLEELSGHFPQDIGDITELRYIYTNECHISGNLPDSITLLKKLYHIEIWYSALSGPIPVLNDNNLTGGLPR
jgi:hypothetical protein